MGLFEPRLVTKEESVIQLVLLITLEFLLHVGCTMHEPEDIDGTSKH